MNLEKIMLKANLSLIFRCHSSVYKFVWLGVVTKLGSEAAVQATWVFMSVSAEFDSPRSVSKLNGKKVVNLVRFLK